VVNEFLVELTGNDPGTSWFVLIDATNYPKKLDGAMKHRLQRSVLLGMHSFDERKALYTLDIDQWAGL